MANPAEDIFASYGRYISQRHFKRVLPEHTVENYPIPPHLKPKENEDQPGTVGILGAGPGGLYVAMILESLNIDYQIIEAQDHVGGRLFTHWFTQDPSGSGFNYYDVGAMRFPPTSAMRRLTTLFDKLNVKTQPYIFSCDQQLYKFNDIAYTHANLPQPPTDAFNSEAVISDVPSQPYINVGYEKIVNDALQSFRDLLKNDTGFVDTAVWKQMDVYESYSTRAYLSLKYSPSRGLGIGTSSLSADVVNWCETFDKSTGWYDRALTETILEDIAFNEPNPGSTDWLCVVGGAQEIANDMKNSLSNGGAQNLTLNAPVRSISQESGSVVVTGDNFSKTFQNVISTIPLPVMRTLDLSGAGLSPIQSNALRELNYGPAVKIGLLFDEAWWTTAKNNQGVQLNIVGGQSYTDSILRTVVYPSFGDIAHNTTTTLIATYCWTEDAARFGALMNISPAQDTVLQNLVLRELDRLHDLPPGTAASYFKEMHAWSWAHNPYSMGAYAFFGPGKFETVYTSLTHAADGHLFFAGEALSTRHAWVEGALDSAWTAVAHLLIPYPIKLAEFLAKWGINPEWVPPGATNDPSALSDPKRSILIQHLAATHAKNERARRGSK